MSGKGKEAAAADPALAKANELKEVANTKYKAGDYAGAIASYTAAIAAGPPDYSLSLLYSNRAAAAVMIKQ